jgi:UDP-2,4-diacetamido-2,4,6-trideoxy-beta-L-altropyranose hydrolase
MKALLVRADATARIGSGHFMRCLALVEQWLATGGVATFLSNCDSELLRRRSELAGARFVPLPKPYPSPDDCVMTLALAEQFERDPAIGKRPCVVLDGYHFTESYQQAIRGAGCKLMVIDDCAQLRHYHADLLLNQNIGSEDLTYRCDPNAKLLLGTRYVLLRPEFRRWQHFERTTRAVARKILVTMGGSDYDNLTAGVIDAVRSIDLFDLEVVVVAGSNNPHYPALRAQALELSRERHESNRGFSLRVEQNVSEMSELMAWADLAISGGGSTCWELMFLQLPFLVVSKAALEEPLVAELHRRGIAISLGNHSQITPERIVRALVELIPNARRREELAKAGRRLVDGDGARRVVAAMMAAHA